MSNLFLITFAVVIVATLSCASSEPTPPATTQWAELPKVSVALLESVDKAQGIEVPQNVKTDRSGSFRSMDPCRASRERVVFAAPIRRIR